MYSTKEALTNAIIDGEPINKELRLLDSDGVVIKTIKSLKLYSGSNSTSRIQLGSTNSSYIEASIEYDKVLASKEMALYCGIDSEMIPMGIYKIMQEPTEDDGIISFKAYDRMRLLDKLYEPTVVIPNGFKNVVDDIAKQCGVTVNFNHTGGTVRNYIKGYTCREMIGYIASMLGNFAYFDRQGVLNFGWYAWGSPVEKTLSSFWSLKKDSNDYKVTGVEFIVNSDTKYLAGSEPNIIYCSNPLADRGDAENVYYGPMRDLTYRPAEISMLDDIRLDVTDVIKVTLLDGTTIRVPCMTLNQDFTASETKVKAVGNAEGEASNYSGPLTTAMDRLTTDLLLTNRVVATKVDAEWVRANTVTADKITAIQAEIDEINANNITTDNLSANVAKLGYLTADSAVIKGKLDTSELSAEVAKLGYLTADSAVIKGKLDTNQLSAEVAKLGYLTADSAVIKGKLDTSELSSEVAKLGYLSASEADIKYANIKLSNIETANVATLFAKVGLIDRATVVEGHITGYLDSVEVNANKITAGTLVADRILLKGSENGLLYALNNLGELTSTTVDSLDGYVLTDRTVNADKIVANSITAKELDVANIFANNAVISTITSQQAFINAISTNSVVVGASNTANAANTTANSALNKVDNLQVGGTNLIPNTHKTAVTMTYPASGHYADYCKVKTTTPLNGDIYTLSFWAKSTVNGDKVVTYFYNPDNVTSINGSQGQRSTSNTDGRCTFTLSTVLTKYWVTYTILKNSNSTKNVIIPRMWGGYGTGTVTVQWEKLEEGNKATDWSPAPEDISVENVYSPNTTTIDGGKITTNSIKAKQIDVTNLFAQDITASGKITGAKLYGTYLESTSGKIADFNITENGFSRELDWVDSGSEAPYKAWCEIDPNSPGYINKGAGAGIFSFKSPSFKQGYYNKYTSPTTGEIVSDKITSFETHMFGMRTDYFEAKRVNSDLTSIPTDDAEPTPSGYEYTYYNLGSDGAPWETLYARNIVVKKSLKDDNGKITAQGDIIAGLGTSKQVSLQGLYGTVENVVIGLHFQKYVDKLTAKNGVQIEIPYTTPEYYKYMITTSTQSYGCAASCSYQGVDLSRNIIYVYVYPFGTNPAYIEVTVLFTKA